MNTKIVKIKEDASEVWWESTLEYELELDGETYTVRYNESPKWTNIYVLSNGQWLEVHEESDIPQEVYEIATTLSTSCKDAGEYELTWDEEYQEWTY